MDAQQTDETRETRLDETAVQDFIARVRGPVLRPGDAAYDEARRIWNGLIDRCPALIVRCTGTADVVEAVNFARTNELLVSVRGGGHNVSGNAVNDGGIVVDLSLMNGVHVDPAARTARAAGGATWGDVDRETQLFGLATPGGNVSTTGIAGLTLHGGMGHLRRKYGLSIDNLLSVDIVTADGQVRTASETENADLFWAVRGAGSNFGVVTSFEYRLHPVGPLVMLGALFYALEDAGKVLPDWRHFVATAPEEINSFVVLWNVPAGEPFPEPLHGRAGMAVVALHAGPVEEGERAMQPLRELATPLLDMSGPIPYTAVQSLIDAAFPKGGLYYWKSRFLDELSDEAVDALVRHAAERPSPTMQIALWHLGGAIARVGAEATAFGRRDASFMLSYDSTWFDPQETERNVQWTREVWASMQRFSRDGLYLNFAGFGEEKEALVRSSYAPNYERLVALKTKYDPTNLFRMNQNIKPRRETGVGA